MDAAQLLADIVHLYMRSPKFSDGMRTVTDEDGNVFSAEFTPGQVSWTYTSGGEETSGVTDDIEKAWKTEIRQAMGVRFPGDE